MGFFSNFWTNVEAEWTKLFGAAGPHLSAAIVSDIQIIGSGLSGALAAFEAVSGLSPAQVTNIQAAISGIESAAVTVNGTLTTNAALPIVNQIANDFSALQSLLSAFTLPPAVKNIMNAVVTLLPYIEAGVGILTMSNSAASVSVAKSEATGLSAAQARAILAGTKRPAAGLHTAAPVHPAAAPLPAAEPPHVGMTEQQARDALSGTKT
jgi:hypothetical protein